MLICTVFIIYSNHKMAKHGKKRQEAAKAIDVTKAYPLTEAIALLKKIGYTKFDGSVEIAVKTNADAKYNDQMMRGTTILPHGTGKSKRIAVFTADEKAAKDAWADIAGIENLLTDIKAGKFDFDILLTTPEQIRDLAPVAKQLGPKGLMPSPKAGTVVANIPQAVEEFKKGKVEFKLDKTGNVNGSVGKMSFTEAQIEENITSFLKALEDNKPTGVKGKLIKKIYIAPTMGPWIQIQY